MEHTKAYQEFKKNGNTKFVRYSEGAEMYHMGMEYIERSLPTGSSESGRDRLKSLQSTAYFFAVYQWQHWKDDVAELKYMLTHQMQQAFSRKHCTQSRKFLPVFLYMNNLICASLT